MAARTLIGRRGGRSVGTDTPPKCRSVTVTIGQKWAPTASTALGAPKLTSLRKGAMSLIFYSVAFGFYLFALMV
jgi:hypothetical protein